MSPPLAAVRDDDTPPANADVVIIGGGIIGICTAYFLREEGLSIAVVEKGRVAGEQSSRNWGFVRQQGRDPSEIPLIKQSLALWEQFERPPQQSVGFRRAGIIYLTREPEVPEAWRDWMAYAGRHGIESFLLDAAEAQSRAPSPMAWTAGLYTPDDAQAEPALAVPAIAEAARRKGVTIHQQCAVRSIEIERGRAVAVVTEKGRIDAGVVICAAGAWSSRLCRSIGITLPQLAARATVLRTEAAPNVSDAGGIVAEKFSIRRRVDGGYNVARTMGWTYEIVPDTFRFMRAFWPAFLQQKGNMKLRFGRKFFREFTAAWRADARKSSVYEQDRILDPAPDMRVLDEAMTSLRAAFPQLKDVAVAEAWAGMIDIMPDAVPVIGPVPEIGNLMLATGFSGHGFGIGPGAGRLTADLVSGREPIVDPKPFRFDRLGKTIISADVAPQ